MKILNKVFGAINLALEGKKTFIGLIIAVLPTIAGLFGYDLTPVGSVELGGLLSTILDNLNAVIEGSGILIAAYGRLVTRAK